MTVDPDTRDSASLPRHEAGSVQPVLLEALSSLSRISAAINRYGFRDQQGIEPILSSILRAILRVIPQAAVVLRMYDADRHAFSADSRLSAGEQLQTGTEDLPRSDGFGVSALRQHRVLLSYEHPEQQLNPVWETAGACSLACFPLIVADQPLGALYVYLFSARSFADIEMSLLASFADHAAMALFQTHRLQDVQQELVRKEDELTRLRRAGLLISSRLSLHETLETILQMALEVTGAHYGIFRLVDRGGTILVTHAVTGRHSSAPQVEDFPVDSNTIMGWVARHRQPLCIHDLQAAPWNRIYHPLYADLQMRSELAVPLVGSSGRLEGVLNLESPNIGAFNEEDSLLLMSLATQAVIAIQEARLLDVLLEVGQDLLMRPTQAVLDRLVEQACDLLNAAAGTLWMVDGEALTLRAANGAYEHSVTVPLKGSLAGAAVETGRPVRSEDLRTDPRFHRPDLAARQHWARALIVPILSSDKHEPVGALGVYSVAAEPGHFTESEWDEKVLTCLAYYVALALHAEERQAALRSAQERQSIAETFAAVGDIAANVLHHLNNKVGTIPVRVQGIESKCASILATEPYLATALSEIKRSAHETLEAVWENLFYLRPIQPEPVPIAVCVSLAVEISAVPSGVLVQSVGLEDLPAVMSNQCSLSLLFANLIENAVDAMQGQGSITIHGNALSEWVEVVVSDTGPGIPPGCQERIFEFGSGGRKTQYHGGLGFGLWWVKTLLVRLGGSIAVESAVRSGTTFRIRLPRAGGERE